MSEPTVLILGGCGFIGRNLVSHLVSNNLASHIRIVDKVPPQVAWLNSKHKAHFDNDIIAFKSANLINVDSCREAFVPPEGLAWDYVVNCAGETKHGQTDPVYQEGIYKLSLNCATQAGLHNVKRYVEVSSGQMYSSEKKGHVEDANTEPWTYAAKWKRKVEIQLETIANLKYTILRPALIYGLGDKNGLTARLVIAALYKKLNETLKLLWNANLKLNTIHVEDFCRAIVYAYSREDTLGGTYNVVDEGDSTQGKISDIIKDLYEINVDYYGTLVSSVVDLENAADEANDKHLAPWAESCRFDNIVNTPLTPHMDYEMLLHKHLHLDGTKLRTLGFQLEHPQITVDIFREIINDFIQMGLFPKSLM